MITLERFVRDRRLMLLVVEEIVPPDPNAMLVLLTRGITADIIEVKPPGNVRLPPTKAHEVRAAVSSPPFKVAP